MQIGKQSLPHEKSQLECYTVDAILPWNFQFYLKNVSSDDWTLGCPHCNTDDSSGC